MKSNKEIKKIAQNCILVEYEEIKKLKNKIDDNFVEVIRLLLNSSGRVIVTAIGKSANIANKIVATFNSTGQPSVFMHAAEAVHGDLGNIQKEDVVICISRSGNTSEIKLLISLIKNMPNKLIGITGNLRSFLAKEADLVLDVSVDKEACVNNLAPTSSTTAQLVMGDALAVSLLYCNNFTDVDFAKFHPGGTLGKRLSLTLSDLIHENSNVFVQKDDSIQKVIFEISNKRLGATAVLEGNNLVGIITDGDLRRMLESTSEISNVVAKDIMTLNPKNLDEEILAYDALLFMQKYNINQIIITQSNKYKGIVHINEIIKEELT